MEKDTRGTFSLNTFMGYFQGGARSHLFMYIPQFPSKVIDTIEGEKPYSNASIQYFVRATSLPESTIEEMVLTFRGFDYKLGGRRSYSDWTLTFNSDRKYGVRNFFEIWMNKIAEKDNYGLPKDYMNTQSFQLLDYDGSTVRTINLYNAWPKSISPITLDYSSQDIAQFDVTFSYSYYDM